jgi:large-conductance mechanosensitive channel
METIAAFNNTYLFITNPFFNFLTKFNILPLAFSLIISLNLNQLSNSFGKTIISPIINSIFVNSALKLEERTATIGNITLQYGQFLMNLIQFFFTLVTLYLIYVIYYFIAKEELQISPKK